MLKHCFQFVVSVAFACGAPGIAAQISSGTAFAVAPGLLVTNQHVIEDCRSIEVIAADGRRTAAIVDADSQIDLALLRVSGIKGATVRLRNPRVIRLGEPVTVFGFPLAGSLTSGGNFTSGIVSGLRGLRDAAGEIQITAPVQPGNSGGPVMDASGLVIGVVQAKLDALRTARITGDIPQNVNFAISLEVLAEFLAKNNVAFRDGVPTASLNTAKVAELAQSFTFLVECRSKTQQSVASPPKQKPSPPPTQSPAPSPIVEAGELPSCLGTHNTASWTNCRGAAVYSAGGKYDGEFKDGKPHGQGSYSWSSGQKYDGEFKAGKKYGQGTLTWPDGRKYVGEFKDDKEDGHGTLTWPDGRKYVGEYRDGKVNGRGTFTFLNGQIYVGHFKDGNQNGQGTQTFPDGAKYVGEFKDGKYNGEGTLSLANGATFIGGFRNGRFDGRGTYTLADGRKYIGELKDGKENGHGTLTWPDGRKYVGEFKDGKRDGQGSYYGTDGSIFLSGTWENDGFIRGQ